MSRQHKWSDRRSLHGPLQLSPGQQSARSAALTALLCGPRVRGVGPSAGVERWSEISLLLSSFRLRVWVEESLLSSAALTQPVCRDHYSLGWIACRTPHFTTDYWSFLVTLVIWNQNSNNLCIGTVQSTIKCSLSKIGFSQTSLTLHLTL